MNVLKSRLTFYAITAFLPLIAGCGTESKVAAELEAGNGRFAAGAYNEAEVHYLNVLKRRADHPEALARLGMMYHDQGRLAGTFPALFRASELDPTNLDVRARLGLLYLAGGKTAEAQTQAEEILRQDPQNIEAALLLAEAARSEEEISEAVGRLEALEQNGHAGAKAALAGIHLRQGRVTEARELAEAARELAPQAAPIHLLLAQIAQTEKKPDEAERHFRQAAELSPPRGIARLALVRWMLLQKQTEAAKAELAKMTAQAPDWIPAWLLRAELAAGERNFDEAQAHVARALARDASHPNALVMRARFRVAEGKADRAITELQSMVQAYPEAYEPQMELGSAYLATGDLNQAMQAFTRAGALSPARPEPVLALAGVHLRRNDPRAAAGALEPLLERNPRLSAARLMLAEALRSLGDYQRALSILQPLHDAAPDNPQLIALMATLQARGGNTSAAREGYERALELNPHATLVEQLINLDLRSGDLAAARQRAEERLKEAPDAPESHVLLAKVQVAQRETDAAINSLNKAIELRKDVPTPYLMLAQIHAQRGEKAEALRHLGEMLERHPDDQNALLMAAMLQENAGNFADSATHYQKLIELNPRHGVALNNLAYLQAEHIGDLERGQELAERAREVLPLDPSVADTLGWILYQRGQYGRASALLQEAAQRLPENASVQYHLALARYMNGDEAGAQDLLQRAQELKLPPQQAADAQERLALLATDALAPGAEAEPLIERALQRTPHDPVALLRRSAVLERKGDVKAALDALHRAAQANPNNARVLVATARLYEKNQEPARALATAREARRVAGDDPVVAETLGRLAYAAGDHPWAVSLYQEALRRRPNDAELQFDYALAAYSVGRVTDARSAAERAQSAGVFSRSDEAAEFLKLTAPSANLSEAQLAQRLQQDPRNLAALFALAELRAQQQPASAVESYQRVVELYPDFTPALRRLAILTARASEVSSATTNAAVKAREAYPDDMEVTKAAGIHLFRQRNFAQAASLLERAARERGQDAELHYFLGLALAETGDTSRAKDSLKRALDLKLSGEDAADAAKRMGTL